MGEFKLVRGSRPVIWSALHNITICQEDSGPASGAAASETDGGKLKQSKFAIQSPKEAEGRREDSQPEIEAFKKSYVWSGGSD